MPFFLLVVQLSGFVLMKMIFLHSNVSAKENSVEAAYIREKLSSEIAKKAHKRMVQNSDV